MVHRGCCIQGWCTGDDAHRDGAWEMVHTGMVHRRWCTHRWCTEGGAYRDGAHMEGACMNGTCMNGAHRAIKAIGVWREASATEPQLLGHDEESLAWLLAFFPNVQNPSDPRGSGKHCRHSPGCGGSPLKRCCPAGRLCSPKPALSPGDTFSKDLGTGSVGLALQSGRAGQQLGTPRRSGDMWARPCSVPLQLVGDAGRSTVALCAAQAAAPLGTPEGSTSSGVPNEERQQRGVLKCHPPAAHPPGLSPQPNALRAPIPCYLPNRSCHRPAFLLQKYAFEVPGLVFSLPQLCPYPLPELLCSGPEPHLPPTTPLPDPN